MTSNVLKGVVHMAASILRQGMRSSLSIWLLIVTVMLVGHHICKTIEAPSPHRCTPCEPYFAAVPTYLLYLEIPFFSFVLVSVYFTDS